MSRYYGRGYLIMLAITGRNASFFHPICGIYTDPFGQFTTAWGAFEHCETGKTVKWDTDRCNE